MRSAASRITKTVCVTVVMLVLASTVALASEDVSTASDYARRVAEAAAHARAEAVAVDTAEEAEAFAQEIESLLPAAERVQDAGVEIQVDNGVLAALLVDVRSARSREEQRKAALAVQSHLEAVEASGRGTGEAAPPEDPAALAALAGDPAGGVRESFRKLMQRLVDALLSWLQDRLAGLDLGQAGSPTLVRIVIGALVLVLLVATIWLVSRLFRGGARKRMREPLEPDSDEPVVEAARDLPRDALGHADDLAANGNFREALRALFGGAARAMVESGFVKQTKTLTNRELLSGVVRTSAQVHAVLSPLSAAFERAWYGHADPGREGFMAARESYREVVEAAHRERGGEARSL